MVELQRGARRMTRDDGIRVNKRTVDALYVDSRDVVY